MPKAKRNVGQEILEGIRQLKRDEHGRVVKVPSVTRIREKAGLSQPRFARRTPHLEASGVFRIAIAGRGPRTPALDRRDNAVHDFDARSIHLQRHHQH